MSSFSLLLVILVCLGTSIHAYSDCESCISGIKKINDYITLEENIDEQVKEIVDEICSSTEDPSDCEIMVMQWWPSMVSAILQHPGAANLTCQGLTLCDAFGDNGR